MNIITCTERLREFLITLSLTFLLTKPQLNHLASIMIAAVQGGFDGKIKNVPELCMRDIHRTSVGKYLSKSPWPTGLVINSYQLYVLAKIRLQARITGLPIHVILDDTISEKTKPSSKAKKPIDNCGYHHSHLKKKRVYGHQIVCVLLECGGLKLPYYLEMYDKKKQSKISMVKNVIEALPDLPGTVYVLGDSWYSAGSIINTARAKGFKYIGALRANRVLYTDGGPRLGQKVNSYVKTLSSQDVRLVTVGKQRYWIHHFNGFMKNMPQNGVILLTWPINKLFEEDAVHVFFGLCSLPDEEILRIYTERWTIEIFFRDCKMQLELDRYQVRRKQAIERFLLIMMLVYAFCAEIAAYENYTLGESRKLARKDIKCDLVDWIYQQASNGVSLSKINEELGLAS